MSYSSRLFPAKYWVHTIRRTRIRRDARTARHWGVFEFIDQFFLCRHGFIVSSILNIFFKKFGVDARSIMNWMTNDILYVDWFRELWHNFDKFCLAVFSVCA